MQNWDPNCIETVMTIYGMGYGIGMLEVELAVLEGEKNACEIVNSDVWGESLQKSWVVFLWCFLSYSGPSFGGSGQNLML